jgi:hypothetical protein
MSARYLGKQSCGVAAGGLSVGIVTPAENGPVCLHTAGMIPTSRDGIELACRDSRLSFGASAAADRFAPRGYCARVQIIPSRDAGVCLGREIADASR